MFFFGGSLVTIDINGWSKALRSSLAQENRVFGWAIWTLLSLDHCDTPQPMLIIIHQTRYEKSDPQARKKALETRLRQAKSSSQKVNFSGVQSLMKPPVA